MSSNHHQQQQEAQVEQRQQQPLIEQFKYSKRVVLKSILGREDRGLGLVGERVVVGGWVKSKKEKKKPRSHTEEKGGGGGAKAASCCEVILLKVPLLRSVVRAITRRDGVLGGKEDISVPSVAYLTINDGSCVTNLQIVIDSPMSLLSQVMSTGTSILVEGVLQQPSMEGKHAVELKVEKIVHVGVVDLKTYPLAKTRLSLDFLRVYPHLLPKTITMASITRIRNTLSYATHTFFQNNGFIHVHMPVITTTDIGASGKMFQVTTLLQNSEDKGKQIAANDREVINLEVIKEKSSKIEELKRSDSNKEALIAALQDLQKANELACQLEGKERANSSNVGAMDFTKDFFSRPAYLSVSAGLYLESYACSLSSVYTFGPIFRAECSQATKKLAEMWMVEVELAFAELEDAMNCAEDFLKSVILSILHNCSDDLTFLSKRIDKTCIDRLQSIGSKPFARVTYTEALEVLNKATSKTSETKLGWGINLTEEQEGYLTNEVYKQPVIIYDYPKEVQPFYVHIKEDKKTAAAFDIIAPNVGVQVRGSQKEEQIDKISIRMEELGLPREQYDWYLDIRRHGTVKHSGFSIGFENVVMFATGLDDIRDTVPFPRYSGSAST